MIHFFDPWPGLDKDCGVVLGKRVLVFFVTPKSRGVSCWTGAAPNGSSKITSQEFIDRFKLLCKIEKNKLTNNFDVELGNVNGSL